MSIATWKENWRRNRLLVNSSAGPSHVVVVVGTEADREYWQERFAATKSGIFRSDGSTQVLSVHESVPKGNFLGTLNAWRIFTDRLHRTIEGHPRDVMLASMVFGKGKRLSPFTQSLENCKPRFPTPYKSSANGPYLNIGELSNLYSNLLIGYLRESGFRGLVVKWGDEIVIPGVDWYKEQHNYSDVDAVRFVWFAKPTPELAREKDWILVDTRTNSMTFQLARQAASTLQERAKSRRRFQNSRLGVNLGSLAMSYDFLDIACDVFSGDIVDPGKRIDWDPYVWLALACENQREWQEEVEYEAQIGNSSLVELQSKYPDFFQKISLMKNLIAKRKGRPLSIKALDFGKVFWTDFGQHLALRKNLSILLNDTDRGSLTRDLFGLPHKRDRRGNTIIKSEVHPQAQVHDSLIIDSIITGGDTLINRGIIVNSAHKSVHIPDGGISLFCTTRELTFKGPNAIAFHSIVPMVSLPEGGRHSTVVSPDGIYQLLTNEAITDYKGENYSSPILGNPISFAAASRLVDGIAPEILANLKAKVRAAMLKEISRE